MIEELVVRILTKSDILESKMLRLESLKESPLNFGSSYEDELLFDDDIWLKRLTTKDVVTFGAFIDNDIVGSITLSLNKRLKTKHNAGIHGMYVSKQYQKKGVGFKLITALIEYAKELEYIEILSLSVALENDNAINLYKKAGFTKIAEVPYALKINNQYHSFSMMHKILK